MPAASTAMRVGSGFVRDPQRAVAFTDNAAGRSQRFFQHRRELLLCEVCGHVVKLRDLSHRRRRAWRAGRDRSAIVVGPAATSERNAIDTPFSRRARPTLSRRRAFKRRASPPAKRVIANRFKMTPRQCGAARAFHGRRTASPTRAWTSNCCSAPIDRTSFDSS